MNHQSHEKDLDRQLGRLTGNLRDQGITPERDLWPDIESRLDQVDRRRGFSAPGSGGRVWRLAAVAATLALVLGLGYVGTMDPGKTLVAENGGMERGGASDLAAVGQGLVEDSRSALRRLDHTLRELNQAISLDPGNRNLSRLVLLVHQSRAELLRHQTQNL